MTSEQRVSDRLSLIFAIAQNGVIGRGGQLPWDYPEDRAHFLATTKGHAVIMGRRTWEERGSPLPDRTNIVVSRTFQAPPGAFDVVASRSLDDALVEARKRDDDPFVIGGVRLFEEAMARATRLYVTEIPGSPEGDTVLAFDRTRFRVVDERGGEHGLRFLVLEPGVSASRL